MIKHLLEQVYANHFTQTICAVRYSLLSSFGSAFYNISQKSILKHVLQFKLK